MGQIIKISPNGMVEQVDCDNITLDDMQTDALFLEGTIHDLKYPTNWKGYLESEVEKDG